MGFPSRAAGRAGAKQSLPVERAVGQQERSKRTACSSENGKSDVDNESPVSLTAWDTDTERVRRGRWYRNGEGAVLCCRELTWQPSWAGHGKGFGPTELSRECHGETLR